MSPASGNKGTDLISCSTIIVSIQLMSPASGNKSGAYTESGAHTLSLKVSIQLMSPASGNHIKSGAYTKSGAHIKFPFN